MDFKVVDLGFEDIIYEKADGVARVTINRPHVHNAFTVKTLLEMVKAFEDVMDDNTIGVIILTGAGGRAFSTGGDVAWEGELDRTKGQVLMRSCQKLSQVMRNCGKPIIAMVRGYCIGGGNELNILCDLTIASEKAKFGQAGPRMGSVPVWFGTQLLPRLVGDKRARELVYLCWQYTAQEAYEMGLINKVVPDDQLEAEVERWCEELLDRSPQALRVAKFALNAGSDMMLWSVYNHGQMVAEYHNTDEFHEGCDAFVEKRKPNFRPFRR